MSMGTVGVAPGTTTFTLQDGTVISLADWIDDRVYGTIQLSNGLSTSLECFGAGISQQIPGGTRTLTTADTNLQRPGSNGLPQAYELLVFSIGIDLVRACRPPTGQAQPVIGDGAGALSDPVNYRTFFGINRLTNVQFKYREKVYAEGVIVNFPNGRGAWIVTTSPDFQYVNNGRPDPRSRNAMVLPIRIQENLSFKLVFNPQSPLLIAQPPSDGALQPVLNFVDVKAELNGLYKRPVV
jgi:hypothetical protein